MTPPTIDDRTRAALEHEPLPKRPNPWRLFTAFHSSAPRWPGALRAAIAVAVPGALALALGHENATVLIASGGFIVIYGEGHPYRARLSVMATAAMLLVLGATSGAFVGSVMWAQLEAGGSHWWLMLSGLFTVLISTIGTYVQNALRLSPPGVFFIVMVAGGSTMVARLGFNPLEVGGWAIVGAVSAIFVGMSGKLVHPHGPERQAVITADKAVANFEEASSPTLGQHHQAQNAVATAWSALNDAGIISGGNVVDQSQYHLVDRVMDSHRRLVIRNSEVGFSSNDDSDIATLFDEKRLAIPHTRPSVMYRLTRSANRHSHAFITAEKVFFATFLSALVGVALGFDRPDWAVVSALLMLQWGPDRIPGQVRGMHRLFGSLLGIVLFALFHYFEVSGYWLLLVLAVCQFGAEFFVTKNYAFTVIFTTPLALLMGDSMSQPLGTVFVDRTVEVLLSVVFGSLFLWFWRPSAERQNHYRLIIRCRKAMGSLLGALLITPPSGAKEERRDLQYELLSERRAINSLAMDHPDVAIQEWANHGDVQRAGYALLDFCNARNDVQLSPGEIAELAEIVKAAS
ncbi:FUSC family protein [Corynebacterium breve]|uniref:FUSC family protein n=1 Tax=Corynebacterium breve TaxID=3049799 RepID=A0ABY8VDF4_9CORY|nr:FUSC family protein [Corynebacterium breve]WIM67132.1 FUSC family protein [Corynebacterium breve]